MITISVTNSDDPKESMIFEGDLCIIAISKVPNENLKLNAGILGQGNLGQIVDTQVAALTAVSAALGDSAAARRALAIKSLEIIDPEATRRAKSFVEAMRGAKHAN